MSKNLKKVKVPLADRRDETLRREELEKKQRIYLNSKYRRIVKTP
jgi:hypothetical protein